MSKFLLSIGIVGMAILGFLSVFFFFDEKNVVFSVAQEGVWEKVEEKSEGVHSAYYMDASFYGDIDRLGLQKYDGEHIYGGIVSHHFLMAKEISNVFSSLKNQKPKTIIVIGPNHFNMGSKAVLISGYDYDTPWGVVRSDQQKVQKLIDAGVVKKEEKPFEREHSISTLVGFMKYFLPDTQIVPIIVKRNISQDETRELAQAISNVASEDTVVLGSVDFSHHINDVASSFHDERSIAVINNFDFKRLLSTEIDSPGTIDVLLRYLQSKDAKQMSYVHTNLADFSADPFLEDGTSYLFAQFTKGEIKRESKISVLSFGDMMLGRAVKSAMEKGDNPFTEIAGVEGNFLRGVDVISANLEGPITTVEECSTKAYSFKFDPAVTDLLTQHKFNALNLANNHIYDCGTQGKIDTERHLSQSNIGYFGTADSPYFVKEIDETKIAFVGIDTTVGSQNIEKNKNIVQKATSESDYVIVNVHWSIEYAKAPEQRQKDLAYALIDSGADMIIGHHPHVVQPMEVYKNKVIFYSLGNFIFDQIGVEENKGLGVGAIFTDEKIKYYLFPYYIKQFHPNLMSMEDASLYCKDFIAPNLYLENEICQFVL